VSGLSTELREAWPQLGRRPKARTSARRFSEVHPELDLDNIQDLCDLLDLLSSKSLRSQTERTEILSRMLEDARDPQIHQALLVTLIPGLHAKNHRLGEGRYLPGTEQMDLLIESASRVIHDWAGQTRAYAGMDVLNAARCRARREILRERDLHRGVVPLDLTCDPHGEAAPVVEIDEYRSQIESFLGTEHDRVARMTMSRLYGDAAWSDIAEEFGEERSAAVFHVQEFVAREIAIERPLGVTQGKGGASWMD
jgi:hypothetical protein